VHKHKFSLGFSISKVGIVDDLKSIISPRFEAPIDTHVTNLQERLASVYLSCLTLHL